MAQLLVIADIVIFLLCAFCVTGSITQRQRVDIGSGQSETCMTKWLTLAVGSSSTPASVGLYETLMMSISPVVDEDTVANVHPLVLRNFLGGSDSSAAYLTRCMGDNKDTECQLTAPCRNSGKCLHHRLPKSEYVCQCTAGISGDYCEISAPVCSLVPCQNGGTCQESHASPGGYSCSCPALYRGHNCEEQWFSEEQLSSLSNTVLRIQQDVVDSTTMAGSVGTFLDSFQRNMTKTMRAKFEALHRNLTATPQTTSTDIGVIQQSVDDIVFRQQTFGRELQEIRNSISGMMSAQQKVSSSIGDIREQLLRLAETAGPPGVPGVNGNPGLKGDQGTVGPRGPTGKTGVSGRRGSAGGPGLRGDPGLAGQPGRNGAPGSKGAKGSPAGTPFAGYSYNLGRTGPPGPPGRSGPPGSPGLRGLPGGRGLTGRAGGPGPRGIRGPPGLHATIAQPRYEGGRFVQA